MGERLRLVALRPPVVSSTAYGRRGGAAAHTGHEKSLTSLTPPQSSTMSLYYEAASILQNQENIGGSLTSRIYGKKSLKSKPTAIYALVSESTKWSAVLKDVVENSGILKLEKKVGVISLSSRLPISLRLVFRLAGPIKILPRCVLISFLFFCDQPTSVRTKFLTESLSSHPSWLSSSRTICLYQRVASPLQQIIP